MAGRRAHEDTLQLLEMMDELVTLSGDPVHLEKCENEGSGPIGPLTYVRLLHAQSGPTDESLVTEAAAAAMAELGYDVVPPEYEEVLVEGRRPYGEGITIVLRLWSSDGSDHDVRVSGDLEPYVHC